jgi:hypothetical protein
MSVPDHPMVAQAGFVNPGNEFRDRLVETDSDRIAGKHHFRWLGDAF